VIEQPERAPVGGPHRALSSLRHHNFRLFSAGQLISLVGTWMQTVAQGWLVLLLTGDPLALGLVAAAQFTPIIVFGLFAGVLADAVPKRVALLFTQVAALVLAVVLGLLVLTGQVQVWHVYVLAVLLGLVNAVDMPVRQAFVVEMVGREDIANAVALNSAVFNGTRIVGPAIAGVLIATVGLAACFLINAASYAAVIAGLLAMRSGELRLAPPSTLQRSFRSVGDQLTEGLRYVRDHPAVRLSIVVLGIVSTVALNFQTLLPLLARDVLGGDAQVFGFLMAATGVGSLISALSLAFGRSPSIRLLLTGATVIGIATVGLAVSRWLPLSLLLMLLIGWGVIAMAATANTIIQLTTPDALRGRVMSVYITVFAGSVPIGGLFAGVVASVADVPVALAVGGVLAIATAAFAAWRSPSGRLGRFARPLPAEPEHGANPATVGSRRP
jgi:MFS family permease